MKQPRGLNHRSGVMPAQRYPAASRGGGDPVLAGIHVWPSPRAGEGREGAAKRRGWPDKPGQAGPDFE